MSVNDEARLLQRLRDAELPRGFRGFEETATRQLLAEVALAVQQMVEERNRLRGELEQRRAAAEADGADAEAVGRALVTANAVAEKLVAAAKEEAAQTTAAATAEAERLLAGARAAAADAEREASETRARLEEELDRLRREIEVARTRVDSEREAALRQTRAEGEQIVAAARARAEALHDEAEGLRAVLASRMRSVVDVARGALEELEQLDTGRAQPEGRAQPGGRDPSELLAALRRPVSGDGPAGADASQPDTTA